MAQALCLALPRPIHMAQALPATTALTGPSAAPERLIC